MKEEKERERIQNTVWIVYFKLFLCYSRLVIGNSSLWVTNTDTVSCVLSGPSAHIVIERTSRKHGCPVFYSMHAIAIVPHLTFRSYCKKFSCRGAEDLSDLLAIFPRPYSEH